MRTILETVEATAGFLSTCGAIKLAPGLNCIIGPPGSCKSVLLESIRFAFNCNQERIAILEGAPGESGYTNKIGGTLDSGTIVCGVVDLDSDAKYTIEREHGEEPRLYRAGVKEYSDLSPSRIEIYSQGELQLIAEDAAQALLLIDRPNIDHVELIRSKRIRLSSKLRELGQQIQSTRSQIDSLRQRIRTLPQLRSQLEFSVRSRPTVSDHLDQEHDNFVTRKRALEAVERAIMARETALEIYSDARQHIANMQRAIELLQALQIEPAKECYDALKARFAALDSLQREIESETNLDLSEPLAGLHSNCEALDEPFYQLREQEQAANEWIKSNQRLKTEVEELEVAEKELTGFQNQLDSLIVQRQKLRADVQMYSDEIYELRAREVNEINTQYASNVILRLSPGANCEKYTSAMRNLLNRSRLRDQDSIARELVENLKPAELIDIVEAGDATPLAHALGRDLSQMTRLMSFLIDSSNLCELETLVFEDELAISMYDAGIAKPLNELSKGQKATALLPLILREAPYPLIFDQPEDDLDNRFISKKLVEMVGKLKSKRQIIFVTHNANIPVLGDADCVTVMQMQNAKQAGVPRQGKVDEQRNQILELLEGGEEAFRHRQEIYDRLSHRLVHLEAPQTASV